MTEKLSNYLPLFADLNAGRLATLKRLLLDIFTIESR